jgi:hypothetical protein
MSYVYNAYKIISKLIWIDAKVNNNENKEYQNLLRKKYKLNIQTFEDASLGIKALEQIQFESIFVITSGTIYPEFFSYMKRTYNELRVVPFSIIFTSSTNLFIEKHKNDEIGKIYNETFFNRGGVVDKFEGVLYFIDYIYTNLNNFKTCNKYDGIYTKNYSFLTVFQNLNDFSSLPQFYKDIYKNKNIDFDLLNEFTKFYLKNFCTKKIEKLLKPLILFKEVPEVIISKWWARTYTAESPFYSVMNRALMKSDYKEYETYIRLLYRGLTCNSYHPKYNSKLVRGTKLDLSEINYLKSISNTNTIIFNKSFLSFSVKNKEFKKAIAFQDNCERIEDEDEDELNEANPPTKLWKGEIKIKENEEETKSLNVIIEISNINEDDKSKYIISNAYLQDISYFSKEEEVLVFPFTGFEVTGWENYSFSHEKNRLKGTLFYFKFSKKYKELIKEEYD